MTNSEYLETLHALGLKPCAKKTARMLGLSVRQCQRLAAGQSPVSDTLDRLLMLLIRDELRV